MPSLCSACKARFVTTVNGLVKDGFCEQCRKNKPKAFNFLCDARIGMMIIAKNLKEAKKEWESICESIESNKSIHISNVKCDQLHISVADQEPEIEEILNRKSP